MKYESFCHFSSLEPETLPQYLPNEHGLKLDLLIGQKEPILAKETLNLHLHEIHASQLYIRLSVVGDEEERDQWEHCQRHGGRRALPEEKKFPLESVLSCDNTACDVGPGKSRCISTHWLLQSKTGDMTDPVLQCVVDICHVFEKLSPSWDDDEGNSLTSIPLEVPEVSGGKDVMCLVKEEDTKGLLMKLDITHLENLARQKRIDETVIQNLRRFPVQVFKEKLIDALAEKHSMRQLFEATVTLLPRGVDLCHEPTVGEPDTGHGANNRRVITRDEQPIMGTAARPQGGLYVCNRSLTSESDSQTTHARSLGSSCGSGGSISDNFDESLTRCQPSSPASPQPSVVFSEHTEWASCETQQWHTADTPDD